MELEFYPLRFCFLAKDSIYFPAGKPGNILRGAFGIVFKRIACVPECVDARTCDLRAQCAYARIFEPASLGTGPSGLADWPRPFVFRAAHLDGSTIAPGQTFHFDLNVFDVRDPSVAYFVQTFSELAREGLGPHRGRAQLESVWHARPRRRAHAGTEQNVRAAIAPARSRSRTRPHGARRLSDPDGIEERPRSRLASGVPRSVRAASATASAPFERSTVPARSISISRKWEAARPPCA